MRKTIITIAGRTASGKTSITRKLSEELGLKLLQSYAAREPRPDEAANLEHSDHIFISNEEYDKLENIVAETTINGVRYCTTMDMLNQSDFYIIDPNGIDYLKEKHSKDFRIVQFLIYAEEDIRRKRFEERGKTQSEFDARNTDESKQFDEYESNHGYDIIIFNNGNLNDAVNVMKSYVEIVLENRLKEIEAKKNGTWVETKDKSEAKEQESSIVNSEDVTNDNSEQCSSFPDTIEASHVFNEEQPNVNHVFPSCNNTVCEKEDNKSENEKEISDDPFNLDDDDDENDENCDDTEVENISTASVPKASDSTESNLFGLDDSNEFEPDDKASSMESKSEDMAEEIGPTENSKAVVTKNSDEEKLIPEASGVNLSEPEDDDDDDDDDGEEAILV